MVALAEMTPAKRREVISLSADFVLRDATADLATHELARSIARTLNEPPAFVARILLDLAKRGDVRAYKTGETFERYGSIRHRRAWRAPCKLSPETVWSV